jgi:hypothetical protein
VTPATCRNCDAPLTGPYCAQCGQHAHDSARSLGALLHDAWHVITHVDSRFWSTLWLLLTRPGQLTLEYFAERRARYVPPVRLYLVISILFFGLNSLQSLLRPEVTLTDQDALKHVAVDLEEFRRDARQAALEARKGAAAGNTTLAADDAAKVAAGGTAQAAPAEARDESGGLNLDLEDCDKLKVSPHWLEQPLRDACRRNLADHGKTLKHAIGANIPKMMFVFLPLIALLMLLLYWSPRRYYVEHLVFVLHNHAALFLAMVLLSLLEIAAWLLPALQRPAAVGGVAVLCYAAWYVYRSMRRYYGQGRWLTAGKLMLIGFAYLLCLLLTLLGTVVVSLLIA